MRQRQVRLRKAAAAPLLSPARNAQRATSDRPSSMRNLACHEWPARLARSPGSPGQVSGRQSAPLFGRRDQRRRRARARARPIKHWRNLELDVFTLASGGSCCVSLHQIVNDSAALAARPTSGRHIPFHGHQSAELRNCYDYFGCPGDGSAACGARRVKFEAELEPASLRANTRELAKCKHTELLTTLLIFTFEAG